MPKNSIDQLAILGGSPAFENALHVGRPNIGDRDSFLRRVNDLLDRRWLTNNGPFVQEFEEKIRGYLGVKHCLAISNGTRALEIAIRAIGLTGEVIIPSFTFVATAHALQWQEITPVFCDVAPNSHHIDPNRVEDMITPRTSAIMGVHVWGMPCDIEALQAIADRHHLNLLFDAAHAFGSTYKGQMIGQFGQAEVLSFHATKFLNTFEGGAIVTNDDDLARKINYMRNFGFSDYDQVDYIGINGKMSEIAAAMGLNVLEGLDEIIATNYRNYKLYTQHLENIPGVHLYEYSETEKNNYQYIILEIDEAVTGISRDLIVKILHAENVLVRRYFYPGCHEMEPYKSYFPHAGLLLPQTNKLTRRVISLPNGTSISKSDVKEICQLMGFIIQNHHHIVSYEI